MLEMKIPDQCMAFTNREEWRAWLEVHHATEHGSLAAHQ